MDKKLFWENVKACIKEQNTTQEWLCKECGLVLSSFRNRINKNRTPDICEGYLIAKALNTTVEYLITGNSGEIPLDVFTLSEFLVTMPEAKRQIAVKSAMSFAIVLSEPMIDIIINGEIDNITS